MDQTLLPDMRRRPRLYWRDGLYFTRRERLGVLVLSLLLLAAILIPELWLHLHQPPPPEYEEVDAWVDARQPPADSLQAEPVLRDFDPNTATLDDFLTMGLTQRTARSILNYRSKGGQFRRPDDLAKIYTLDEADFQRLRPYIRIAGQDRTPQAVGWADPSAPVVAEAFYFDPNTVTVEAMKRLGLSAKAIRGIERYRSKGGKFYKAADFDELYSVSAQDKARLRPYIRVEKKAAGDRRVIADAATTAPPLSTVPTAYERAPDLYIDINQADQASWELLPGIGSARAKQIVRFRSALGGFISVQQVAETYRLPDSVFQHIQPFLHPSDLLRPLSINTISEQDLQRHPYISRRQAKAIVAYRASHGPFADEAAFRQLRALPRETQDQIMPYLRFE